MYTGIEVVHTSAQCMSMVVAFSHLENNFWNCHLLNGNKYGEVKVTIAYLLARSLSDSETEWTDDRISSTKYTQIVKQKKNNKKKKPFRSSLNKVHWRVYLSRVYKRCLIQLSVQVSHYISSAKTKCSACLQHSGFFSFVTSSSNNFIFIFECLCVCFSVCLCFFHVSSVALCVM